MGPENSIQVERDRLAIRHEFHVVIAAIPVHRIVKWSNGNGAIGGPVVVAAMIRGRRGAAGSTSRYHECRERGFGEADPTGEERERASNRRDCVYRDCRSKPDGAEPESAKAEAASQRDRIVGEARAQAEQLAKAASAAREASVADARGRLDATAEKLAASLRG